jgi:epsilon-lactone hydrolase
MSEPTGPVCYQIRVRGLLGETLLAAFPDLRARPHGTQTVLTGPLPDLAALYGVLHQIEALGLELLELRRTKAP